MGQIVVLGEAVTVESFALAGATVVAAEDVEAVRRAWAALPADAAIVVLTAAAAEALGEAARTARDERLTIALPG